MKHLLPILLLLHALPAHADDGPISSAINAVVDLAATALSGTDTSPDGGGSDD